MQRQLEQKIMSARHQLELYIEELKGLSPLYKLKGGYAYVSDTDGKQIASVEQLSSGQQLDLTLQDGKALVSVQEVSRNGE